MPPLIGRKQSTYLFYCYKAAVFLLFVIISSLASCTNAEPKEMVSTVLSNPAKTAVSPTAAISTPTLGPTAVPPTKAIPTPSPEPTAVPVPTLTLLGDYPLLSPEDMRYDLDELFHRLETTHPNPYAKRPKDEVDLERARINDELARPLTMIDFFKKVAPLIFSLGDTHTQVDLPDATLDEIIKNERFFPFTVQIEGEHAYIIDNYSGDVDIALGTELLAVNDIPITTMWDEAKGYSDRYFSPLHFFLLFGSLPEYRVTLLPKANTPVTQIVPGVTASEVMQQVVTEYQPEEPVTYTTVLGEPIGVLTINTFSTGLGPALKSAFTQIQADGVQHLIIDVRTNGGGYYAQVQSIMDYLANNLYRSCAQSIQAPFRGYGSGEPREMECEVIQPFAVAERYQGKIYLLIGPDTFSASITLATILQDYDMGLLIGEETTDSASYCADVPLEMSSLPRTGLRYRISRTCYVRPSGVLDDQPVVPDIIVKTAVIDQIAGNDPVLTYTLEMIQDDQ
ncbi:MAG: hypothetical protein H6667_23975 [Ardenticatenaceae bacterium]|nr:hypothetical protein [Ardenticatenaceae bacterium]